MLIVRPVSAIGGLLALIALSRTLTASDYGRYFTFWAVVEILILVSNLGLLHAAYRYVSAIEWADGSVTINGPTSQLVAMRTLSLLTFSALFFLLPNGLSLFASINHNLTDLVPIIVAVTLFEGLARYIEVIFDSMLFQKSSQITQLSRTLFRLIGFGSLTLLSKLNLQTVLVLEIFAALFGMIFTLILFVRMKRKSVPTRENQNTEKLNVKRALKFSLPAYATQALGISYGPDSLKLALGSVAGAAAVAVFGFAYSLAAVIQRYMPVNIFAGVMRPIFVAAAKQKNQDAVLSDLLSASIKINWVFILSILCFFVFSGDALLSRLSNGQYPNAGQVATLIIFGFLAIAIHLNLSMYCLSQETSWPPLFATLASTLGLPIGYVLGREAGPIGIAIAFGLSELIWSIVCLIALRASSAQIKVSWLSFLKMLAIAFTSVLVSMPLAKIWPEFWLLPSLFAPTLFLAGLFTFSVFSLQERTWAISVLPVDKFKFLKKWA